MVAIGRRVEVAAILWFEAKRRPASFAVFDKMVGREGGLNGG